MVKKNLTGFKVIKNPNGVGFRVKNLKTGKVGKDKFKQKKNAQIQVKNRHRFLKLISNSN